MEACTEQLMRSPHIKESYTQDGAVLLDIRRGACFSVNPVGALIWKQIANGHPLPAIAASISMTFSIPYEQASVDVSEFVQQLEQRQLVHKAADGEKPRSSLLTMLGEIVSRLWNGRSRSVGGA